MNPHNRDWEEDELTAQRYKRSVEDIRAVDLSGLKRIVDIAIAALAERKRLAAEVERLKKVTEVSEDA